ncbi:TetR/AcrR family transcriptional regulator [Micromonospora narathiwatensis]|uniref:Transcriptional regulator, TetR family n=1 Tax=Micromonospora narathiwatensis TaxID=299146 RepID=A0A1A8ZFE2_9ACTN|nr:TetR/AcrR family transcriptional regulator [Micromonospora narathiwatensis]SBT42589.1 transcriptional regulator, TetR family [Micromonospora narathiwatensis]
MNAKRAYVQTARAAAAAQTRQRILDATVALARQQMSVDIVLNDVAESAAVSVQTVLRHFGSRDALFEAAAAYAVQQVSAERGSPVGDTDAAVRSLFDHYEQWGEVMLRLLAQETRDPKAYVVTEQGRVLHRDWVTEVFAPMLAARPSDARDAVTDLLVIATDLYTWKLLIRDRRLPREQAEARVRQLIAAVLGESP